LCFQFFQEFTQEFSGRTREFGGTGLGLAISKHLVELHGGEIDVNSEVGKGSEFWFTLLFQKSNQTEINLMIPNFDKKSIEEKKLRILLAEDNLMNQKIAKNAISKMGYEIDIANNGLEALNMYIATKYDIILMDIQMPEMDGITATKKIRDFENEMFIEKKVKIIAFTANFLKEDLDLYKQSDMDDYISKPFKSSELSQIIEKHLK
jgi:CheY-like chemotaxis protein